MEKNIKIDLKSFSLFLMIMPYLKPYNVTLIPTLDDVFKLWKILSTIYLLVAFFKLKIELHKESFFLIVFCAIWIFSLIINSGPIFEYLNNILSIIGLMLLFEMNATNTYFSKRIVKLLYKIGAVYMSLNFITALYRRPFFAEGMQLADNANFLGGDNYSAFILITYSGLMFFYDDMSFGSIRLKTWIYNIFGLLSLVIPFALTGLISMLFLFGVMVLRNRKLTRKVFDWRIIMGIGCLFVISISYLNLDVLLSYILGTVDKIGFNGRNMIWPLTIMAILKKPIFGYGGLTQEQASSWVIAGANHAHNFLLQIPFSCGFFGTVFFTIYLHKILEGINSEKNKSLYILLMTLSAFFMCSIFDFYIGLVYFYLLLNIIWINKLTLRSIQ